MHTNLTAEIYSDMLKLYEYQFDYDENTGTKGVVVTTPENDDDMIHSSRGRYCRYSKDIDVLNSTDTIADELTNLLTKEIEDYNIHYDFKDFGDIFRDRLQDIIFKEVEDDNAIPIKYMIKFTSLSDKRQPSRGSFSISGRTTLI